MKKLIVLALLLLALNYIGKQNAPSEESASSDIKESAQTFLGDAYDGLAVCISECKDFISGIMS